MARFLLLLALASVLLIVTESRVTCPMDTQLCLQSGGARCIDDHCLCKEQNVGYGHLGCVFRKHDVCWVVNDPMWRPFSGDCYHAYIPCRIQATDVTVNAWNEDMTDYKSTCRARVFGYQWRINGKQFLLGFDVRLSYEKGSVNGVMGIKVNGELNGAGQYDYRRLTRHDLVGNVWQDVDVSMTKLDNDLGGTNIFEYDVVNNRIELIVSECALTIYFRLPDPTLGMNQNDVPGLLIAINNRKLLFDLFYHEGGLCLNPAYTVDNLVADLGTTKDEAASYMAAAYDRGHAFPSGATDECQALEDDAVLCSDSGDRHFALENCKFILKTEKFLKAYSEDANSADAIDLYRRCVKSLCNADVTGCENVQALINSKPAAAAIPEAAAFVGTSCSAP